MKAVYALYDTPSLAHQAFRSLYNSGIPERQIAVLSREPLEGFDFGSETRSSAIRTIAVVGAAIGMLTGYLLTSLTQQAWPIDTGGMPIVSNWTNLVVIFELTMLGAVLSTVLTFVWMARLPSRLPNFYDPAISDGMIVVAVTNPPEARIAEIEKTLSAGSTHTLRTVES